MALFGNKKEGRQSVVLIDIGSGSVAGAYAHVGGPGDSALPAIYYTKRLCIDPRLDEATDAAMLRTLNDVISLMVKEGAPTLHEETGSGHVDSILVSIAAPWQQTQVTMETIQPGKPFVFTRQMVREFISTHRQLPPDCIDSGETVIATILNGYEVADPYGKRVNRAEVVLLSSALEKKVAQAVEQALRKAYHTHEIAFAAFAPVAYHVLHDLYPHEPDYLILDVSGEGSDLAFVKAGLLVDVGTTSQGIRSLLAAGRSAETLSIEEEARTAMAVEDGYLSADRNARFGIRAKEAKESWLSELSIALRDFASRHALPRTLFLLADDSVREYLTRTLDDPILHSLWLSDEPLRIMPVLPEQFASFVRTGEHASGDIFLAILALYRKSVEKES